MPWERTISSKLIGAMEDDDLKSFRITLKKHPDNLYRDNGSDYLMREAATMGKLEFIKILVEQGIDINTSADSGSKTSPMYQPEGPILWAASKGHLEMVKWLLDQGAKINYEVNGKARCLPLNYAATNGHFEIVKLLVKHGADVHADGTGRSPAQKAKEFGNTEIYDYLMAQPKSSTGKNKKRSDKNPLAKKKKSTPKKSKKAKKKKL